MSGNLHNDPDCAKNPEIVWVKLGVVWVLSWNSEAVRKAYETRRRTTQLMKWVTFYSFAKFFRGPLLKFFCGLWRKVLIKQIQHILLYASLEWFENWGDPTRPYWWHKKDKYSDCNMFRADTISHAALSSGSTLLLVRYFKDHILQKQEWMA